MDGNTTSDGYFYFLCAQSIVSDHDFSIEPESPYGNPIDDRAPQRIDGKKYLYNHFGWAILLLPLTALGTFLADFFSYKTVSMFIASTTNCFITALTVVVLYLFSRKLKYSPRLSTALSLIYGLSTMAFSYATNSFCEPANTLMILLSLFWLYSFCQNRSYPLLVLSGLAMGYACFIRIWDLFLMPGLFLYMAVYHLKEEGSFKPFKLLSIFVLFFLPVLFMILLNESYFYTTSGSSYFWGEGSRNMRGENALNWFKPASILPTGLYGLLLSTGKGILFYNPVMVLSFLNFKNFYLKHRLEAVVFAYIFAAHLIFIGSLAQNVWSGDLAWGPRYLLPVIPFLILFLADQKRSHKLWSKLLIAGGIAGLIIPLPAILVDTDVYSIQMVQKGIKSEELYFSPPFSPIIGTWNMLLGEITSFSKYTPNGFSPWFFRLFDQKIHTQGNEIMTIPPKLTNLVQLVIAGLIFIALNTGYTILSLLRNSEIKNIPSGSKSPFL